MTQSRNLSASQVEGGMKEGQGNARGVAQAEVDLICSVLREQFPEKVAARILGPDTALREEMNFDSMDLIALAAAVENRYERPVIDERSAPTVFATIGSFSVHLASLSAAPPDPTLG